MNISWIRDAKAKVSIFSLRYSASSRVNRTKLPRCRGSLRQLIEKAACAVLHFLHRTVLLYKLVSVEANFMVQDFSHVLTSSETMAAD